MVRSLTIAFINHLDTRKGKAILQKLNQLKNSPDLVALKLGEPHKKNLYFSLAGMRDIEAYSKLTGLKKSAVLQNALYSTLLLSTQEDPEIKKFWEEVILSQIVLIAKAA